MILLPEHDEHDSPLKFPTVSGKAGAFVSLLKVKDKVTVQS